MKTLKVFEKAARIMALFTPEKPEWGISEIAQALNCPKSSVSTIVNSLVHVGMLRRLPNRRYRVGWHILALWETLKASSDFIEVAREEMLKLNAQFGEQVNLSTLEHGSVVFIERIEGTKPIKIDVQMLGNRFPAYAGASGKVLLAYTSWHRVKSWYADEPFEALTPHTITSLEELEKALIQVRRQGYAIDQEEVMEGLSCVAAPIRDASRKVIAALSFSMPTYRFDSMRQIYTAAICKGAEEISRKLGYTPRNGVSGRLPAVNARSSPPQP